MSPKRITAFHGTCWNQPLLPSEEEYLSSAFAEGISPDHSDVGAVYFSESSAVGDFFADHRHADPELQLRVMIEARINLGKTLTERLDPTHPVIRFDGDDYYIPDDRAELHKNLADQGYQGLIVLDDYRFGESPANDIAVFDTSCIQVIGVRVKENEIWTPTLPISLARTQFQSWCESPRSTIVDPFDYQEEEIEELSGIEF